MHIRNAADTIRLAMAAHQEYDDRYWRYVEALRVESPARGASITRLDSAVWRLVAPGGTSVVRYRLRLPTPQESPRAAWRPFLSPTGALVGGPHAFMYVVGAELAPVHVTLDLPGNWRIATGLTPTADPRTYFAPTAEALVEGPMLAGNLSEWRFAIDGVPHRIVYWRAPNATAFDTAAFSRDIRAMAGQAVALFGRPPWREYTFMIQDSAYGALEHANSVTLGAPSSDLARDPNAYLVETAHEFFHAWNLMRIRPAEYRAIDYRPQPPTSGLWFSEGLTLFYADLLLRRARVAPVQFDSTRAAHLERLIGSYLANPGNGRFAAERVSQVAYNAPPDALGDYAVSAHLQGEVIGTVLDLVIRNATAGRRSMDDVMRLMLERHSAERGFVGADIERAVEDVCGCDVTPIFDAHVRNGTPIDFDRYLALIGLRATVGWVPSMNPDGQQRIDLPIYAYDPPAGGPARLVIRNAESAWGRAGLHGGDQLRAVNGTPVTTSRDFRGFLQRLRIGDTVRVEVERPTGRFTATVIATGLVRPMVRIVELPGVTEPVKSLRAAWMLGR
jgi:predicted metalloprotease with PDZ domain